MVISEHVTEASLLVPSSADSSSASSSRSTEATPWLRVFCSWIPWRMFASQSHRREMQCQQELDGLRRWFQETRQDILLGPGHQADPAGLESSRSTPAVSDPHQTKPAASESSFRLGDSWSQGGMEGGFRRDGNGELGKEDEGGRGKQWVRKGEKGRVKIRDNKGDMNVQEDEEGEEWDEEEGDEKEEGRSLDEAEEETDGENKQPHVSDDLELVLSDGQARGGEGDENAGRGNSGLELEGSRKLLQESAPCCDPLVLKLRVQTADLERRMGQIAEKQ
ncbi:unnamed protein product, partial [Closterium sp. NIES-54]